MSPAQEAYEHVLDSLSQGILHEHLLKLALLVDTNKLTYNEAKKACDVLILGEVLSVCGDYL